MDLTLAWSSIGRPRILVLGDLMLDRYTWGDAERISPEAPVVVLRADQEEVRPGGAASVAYLLRHLDVEVFVAGVVGDDSDGRTLRALLWDEGINDIGLLVDSTRPTTAKHRFVGHASDRHPHQILRVDHESRIPLATKLEEQLLQAILTRIEEFDAVLIADYAKGTCTPDLVRQVIATARSCRRPVLIDPGRLPCYDHYQGATLLKPNRLEAECLTGSSLISAEVALVEAAGLRSKFGIDIAVVTLDREGLVVATEDLQSHVPSEPRAVYDITGAGDVVLATLGLCLGSGLSAIEAAHLANVAAGLEVERLGVSPIRRSEILAKLSNSTAPAAKIAAINDVALLAQQYRRQGKRIVFTNGCFDLLHVGHVSYLHEAAAMGDVLIVGVNSDASTRRLKGPARPIVTDRDRATMLAALDCVRHVVVFEEDTPHNLLTQIRPDVLVKGGTTRDVVGREIVEQYGGTVCVSQEVPDVSTTRLIESVQQRCDSQPAIH